MFSKYRFAVQEAKKLRVIIDTDAGCEADDQYAIVHALLTPKCEVKGIIAEQFNPAGGDRSVDTSFAEINRILDLMEITGIPVLKGSYSGLSGDGIPAESEAADLIISEALKLDDKPLFLLCQGAITNVASALLKRPDIAEKFTCIWIGGGVYPEGGWEFNLLNDYHAANALFRSGVELWQVPMDCYTQMQAGYAELQTKVLPYGRIGKYLFEQLVERGAEYNWVCGESWALGDSPVIGLALNPGCGHYEVRKAPIVNEKGEYTGENENLIRVYHDIDSRYILEDFFAKLKIVYG